MLRRTKFWIWLSVVLVGVATLIFLIGPSLFASVLFPLPTTYQGSVSKWAQEYGISPNLLAALIYTESTWNPNAESGSGAVGLTQITQSTSRAIASRLGVSPFKPADLKTNTDLAIRFGAYYISQDIDNYGGDVRTALVAYNGGGAAANALIKGIPNRATVAYANKVERVKEAYDSVYDSWWTKADLPDFSVQPKSSIDLLPKINIVDFWQNLLFTAKDLPANSSSSTSSPDLGNFWKSILPGS